MKKEYRSLANKIIKASQFDKNRIFIDSFGEGIDAVNDRNEFIRAIITDMPPGNYNLSAGKKNSLQDAIYERYGSMISAYCNQNIMLGLSAKYPNKISATFTHDMDTVIIRGDNPKTVDIAKIPNIQTKTKRQSQQKRCDAPRIRSTR